MKNDNLNPPGLNICLVPSPVEAGHENLLNKGTRHRLWNEDNGANFIKVLEGVDINQIK